DADVCAAAGYGVVDYARLLLGEGVRLLQLRGKHAPSRDLLRWVDAIALRVHDVAGALLVTNDRADVALAAGVPHVHVGQDDLGPVDVRALVGADGVVGLSTHTPEQMAAAVREPIDYMAIGP